jgi:peptide/nickel transport system substrate-binding protein
MAGMGDGILEGNVNKAKALLAEAGYDGTPVVLLHSTDLKVLTNLAPIAKQAMEKIGMKVDMQSMDWQTLGGRRVKKEPLAEGGWSAMLTAWGATDIYSPVTMAFLGASCEKATFGWPCDPVMEDLRKAFARETDMVKAKALVDKIQIRWREMPTHIHLGQWTQPTATRANVSGVLSAPIITFWNVDKK